MMRPAVSGYSLGRCLMVEPPQETAFWIQEIQKRIKGKYDLPEMRSRSSSQNIMKPKKTEAGRSTGTRSATLLGAVPKKKEVTNPELYHFKFKLSVGRNSEHVC